ncbi:MAG: hypothetical protein H7A49_17015 [Akkermansiaceae bacterium]|nr:hypothetical protein [Akkermansiaceae bacterium]MCP5545807.1 hypothetical protein [Akkermansiaceae bacterium]
MRRLLPLLLATGPWVRAAEVTVNAPVFGGSNYTLTFSVRNPNEGVYDSATLACLQRVHQAGLNPALNIQGSSGGGNTFTGWNAVFDAEGVIQLTNNGLIPEGTYTVWDTETMALGSSISTTGLERNGSAGHQPFTVAEVLGPGWDPGAWDAVIVRSDDPLLGLRNLTRARPDEILEEAFVGISQDEFSSWSADSRYYEVLEPSDFAAWTDFASEHPSLDPAGDANHNGRSNFLDYASGQDPEAAGLLPIVELNGTTLTLRRRINASDAEPLAEWSDNLDDWFPLEEGVHYSVQSESVAGVMRTWVLDLLSAPPTRFFRQRFGP